MFHSYVLKAKKTNGICWDTSTLQTEYGFILGPKDWCFLRYSIPHKDFPIKSEQQLGW